MDELTPRAFAAARLTIGVSSAARDENAFRISFLICGDTFAYTGAKRDADDVRDVNHSPRDRRFKRGI